MVKRFTIAKPTKSRAHPMVKRFTIAKPTK
jgi:hypothetical protein